MAKFILIFGLLTSQFAFAQIFQLPFTSDKTESGGSALDKLLNDFESIEVNNDFEDKYRKISLEIERQLDLKRSECSETGANKSDKQKCFRVIISTHKRFLEKSFELKKTYLKKIQEDQLSALDEAKEKALKELERQF
ncbi:MAG: hypothetical protein K2P81_03760 [Bacteriovoracaceae bacterium]|nr:hypothetical protein [Bacteriovoracaceae bacterium]